jgi:hypothetical protein
MCDMGTMTNDDPNSTMCEKTTSICMESIYDNDLKYRLTSHKTTPPPSNMEEEVQNKLFLEAVVSVDCSGTATNNESAAATQASPTVTISVTVPNHNNNNINNNNNSTVPTNLRRMGITSTNLGITMLG